MLALAITLSVLVLISLLRFGVIVEYSEAGFVFWAKVGFLKFPLLASKRKKRIKKEIKFIKSNLSMMPGSLRDFKDMLKAVFNALGRFKRRLLIKELTLYYTSAGEDPANTALQYGGANAVFAAIVPEINRKFRVRKIDLRAWFDFTVAEQKIYAKIRLSIAVWEVMYALFALAPILKSIFKNMPKRDNNKREVSNRKDGQDDGKTTDKRTDGHNDAKNEGND